MTLVAVDGVTRAFGGRRFLGPTRPAVQALQGVDLRVERGETLGIVGESGCGKTTLARLVAGLDRPSAGRIAIDGVDLVALARRNRRALAARVQYVFQDPLGALNPRRTVGRAIAGPLMRLRGVARAARRAHVEDLAGRVGLSPAFLDRYPHELSGGQAQRVGIARALAAAPDLVILDEPVSALDVSVQAQVLALLQELKAAEGLTYLFISHDLSVVERVSDRIAVLYAGRVVEEGPAEAVFRRPVHPYTRLLVDSAPVPGRRHDDATADDDPDEPPDPASPAPGCAFVTRCPRAIGLCRSQRPVPEPKAPGRRAACHRPLPPDDAAGA